jgi:hypothetical protein
MMTKTILAIIVGILFFSPKTEALPVSPAHTNVTVTGIPATRPVVLTFKENKKKKLNFLERFIQKATEKRIKKLIEKAKDGKIDADKLARQSNLFGWLSLAALFIFPLASIPLGILAITNGSTALKNNTSLPRLARTGKTTGIISLSILLLSILLVAIIIASFGFN